MNDKSAISKMAAWLEKAEGGEIFKQNIPGGTGEFIDIYLPTLWACYQMARQLAAEEQAEKSTAHGELWEEVRLFQNRLVVNGSSEYGKELNEIISRYAHPKDSKATVNQRQDSLQDQLKTVRKLARENGCYDAEDWIVNMSGKTFTAPATQDEGLALPWHIGNTGTDQVMFLDKNENYAGSVTIRQFQGWGAYDEPRRHKCAEYILEAVNNYHSTASPVPRITADKMAEPVGKVVDEVQKRGKIGRELLFMPTHDIRLPVGTKLYLHPEGNETVCDMCEVLTKLGEVMTASPVPCEVGPLAIAAHKKGIFIRYIAFAFSRWIIWLDYEEDKTALKQINSDTYAEAETLARAYLSNLPDVEVK